MWRSLGVDWWLRRRGPRTKLLGALALIIAVFFLQTPWAYLGFTMLLLTLVALTGVEWRVLLRGIAMLGGLIAPAFLLQVLLAPNLDGVIRGAVLAGRLVLIATVSFLLNKVMGPWELAEGLTGLLRPLRALGLPIGKFGLVLGLALRLVPQVERDLWAIMRAQRARGIALEGPLLQRMRRSLAILFPLLVHTLQGAEELAAALAARGFSIANPNPSPGPDPRRSEPGQNLNPKS